jgi:hypothetical protein
MIRALPESPAMLRSYARAILTEWGLPALSDTAELIISELVTNILQASPPENFPPDFGNPLPLFQVGLFSDRTILLIEVFDTLPGKPEPRAAAVGDEHGRGLAIVEALSEAWGTCPHPQGKVVYARLRAA